MWTCAACETQNGERAKFCQECGASAPSPVDPRRRLVAALFCDLVGSTELAERLDPEILRRLLDSYFDSMRTAIERHGGVVEKFIGDAVVGVFGVPVGHEDDALRAVRAALDMRRAAAEVDVPGDGQDGRLRIRIAIHGGEALADEGAAAHGRIGGDVFNTAARLQSVAGPDEIVVSSAVRSLLRGSAELSPLGPVDLRGKSRPVDAYRLVALLPATARTETPTIGRDRQTAALVGSFEDAVEAQAAVLATVLAPAGVGKSRLAEALGAAVRDRATILTGHTPPYGDGVTFAPLVELLAGAAGRPSADAPTVAAGIRDVLAGQPDDEAVGDRIAQLLGVGQALATDASWAVRRVLETLASSRPLVVVLEDLHWAEPPMLDLVESIADRLHGPVLLLCLARPELLEQRPTWAGGRLRALTTTLPPLGPTDARRLAGVLLGPAVPSGVVDRICERAEGNPLYLEQLAAMLVDEGLLRDGRWLGPADAEVDIPPTLHALVAARLDRLDAGLRLVIERASVEGRRFRRSMLATLAPEVPADDVDRSLAELDRRGLVEPEDEAAGRWSFGHALVREAAYRGLTKERRAELHERLADRLLVADADQADVDEAAARHLERAFRLREELGLVDTRSGVLSRRSGELFAAAGERAFEALDLVTARDLLGRAAVLLPEDSGRRYELLPKLGVALTETGRAVESDALLERAVDRARTAGHERDALRASIQLNANRVYASTNRAEIEAARSEAAAAAAAFESWGDDVGMAEAAIAIEYLDFMHGRGASALAWATRAFLSGRRAGVPRETAQGAADIVGFTIAGPTPFDRLGDTIKALGPDDDPITASTRLALLAVAAIGRGDRAAFARHEAARREIAERQGLAWLQATHDLVMGALEYLAGDAEAAERRLRRARDPLVAFGDVWWIGTLDTILCAAVAEQDRPAEFLRLADDFLATPLVADRQTIGRARCLRARAELLRGLAVDAERSAREGVELFDGTDLLIDQADSRLVLATVLDARGFTGEAAAARAAAIERFTAKAFPAAVARVPRG